MFNDLDTAYILAQIERSMIAMRSAWVAIVLESCNDGPDADTPVARGLPFRSPDGGGADGRINFDQCDAFSVACQLLPDEVSCLFIHMSHLSHAFD
ncbi:hypothetical protein WI99_01870 [Burkholderia cepacia]|nr:hypothetical protein WI99_01870 [Burkholderia cepacia]